MIFLNDNDLKPFIQNDILQHVIEEDTAVLGQVERIVIEHISSYLQNRYDAAAAFAKADLERNPVVVMYAVDMLLYHVHSRLTPNQIPEIRQLRYENALEWLKSIAKGQLSADLPEKTEQRQNEGNNVFLATELKRNNRY